MKYLIMELSDDGLVKHPQHHERYYGEQSTFNEYGYESVEDAQYALDESTEASEYSDYLLIPTICKSSNDSRDN